ncbi:MAG TPA: hypothetical protein VLJ16_01690 [Acidobacteriota bacterium]|nr:hypothetical protein [Acidobacteriota bacterium]
MRKQMLSQQRASIELSLQERLAFLSKKGIESPKAEKDTIVRKLKADIKAVNMRLRVVADRAKRSEEMALAKVEKASPPKEKEPAKSDKPKKAGAEGKAPKAKPEGGKPPKAAGPAGPAKTEAQANLDAKSKEPAA